METSIRREDQRLLGSWLTRRILRCALNVHQGPVHIPLVYKGEEIDCGFRADIMVERKVLLELKTVERLLPIHEAQVLTYLRLSRLRVGFLLNFNALNLRNGIRRMVL